MTRTLFVAALLTMPVSTHAVQLTVVELFQSQGCSSCPPANANVNALAARPDTLALSYAVTYWDQLGWKDRFATPANTRRQWDYAKGMRHDQVWTPQVVINGRADITGVRAQPLLTLIAATPRLQGPSVSVSGATVVVGRATAPTQPADVWLVRYDPRSVAVAIKAGENNGRTLPHRNIVRELTRLGRWSGKVQSYNLPVGASGLSTAILIQAPRGGPILAAARG